jgi:hypothetical protein
MLQAPTRHGRRILAAYDPHAGGGTNFVRAARDRNSSADVEVAAREGHRAEISLTQRHLWRSTRRQSRFSTP